MEVIITRHSIRNNCCYLGTLNRELLHANIVNLVHIPSIAAQQAVDTIENELNSLNWGQSQCDALNVVLLELTKLLPCRQFATEFIRKGGHEVLFHLVESFDCSDQLPTPADTDRQLDSSPEFDVWSNLVACLVELAEYSINSSELDTDLEQTEAGDDRSSNYSRRISIDSQSSYGDSKDATLMRSASDANMNELFSWHLASKKFLSVLVCRCRAETRLETLRNTLKLLLSVLINCPPGAESVISQTGPEFILSQLKKVHTIPTTDRSFLSCNPGTTPNLTRRWGSRGESPGMLPVSPHPSTPPSWSRGEKTCDCRSVPGCINNPLLCELVSTLCDIIYVILYRSRQSGRLSDALPAYLSNRHLNELITCCAPFSSNDIPVYTPRKPTGPNELTGKNALVKRASDSGLNVNGSTSYTDLSPVRRHGSTASGQSIFFFPDPADPSFRNWTFSKQFRSQATCSSRACQAEQNALNSLYRLHHVVLVWLADLLNTPVNRESVVWSDKMKRFCALALDGDSVSSAIGTEDKEAIYTLLGFKHPEDPFLDFESPPGLLGLSCLCTLLQECDSLKGDILSYGRACLRNVAPVLSSVPFSCKTNVKMHATRRSVPDRTESVQSSVLCRRRRSTVDPHVPSLTINGITPTNHFSDIHRPLFPLVEAANALVNMLCELLGVHDNLYPLYSRCPQHSRPTLFPILFRPRRHLMPFEELFICTFSVFFYSWAHMQATPDDLTVVLSVLREQLKQTVLKNPNSLDAFEQHLTRCTPETVRGVWKELEEQSRSRMLSSHPALRELRMDLIKQHELNVREQRINALTNRAPLDYVPAKGTRQQQGRENQKFEVTLSPDHKSLIVHDTKQESSELWPIGCIDRVVTGVEEKVKKNPALTLVVYMRFRDMPDTSQVHLVARSQLDYKYWLDGFHILLRRGPKSDQFDSDIQQLVDLDMKIRLSGLDLQQLPRKPRPIPPDPPEFDFDENCL
ncbi:hypothetical protein EG68_02288 [Paragonimus skrjabini miyazakii]|uniref:ELMO domain-containing protein n=1 Tax=Paragonimus skrjabini miyazakii TaxID=59628 RepID=A0A8S9Z4D5_9TREM|nr:hypothetical protein EG68_02288 [Paragonimus skrjabini miyazakii]